MANQEDEREGPPEEVIQRMYADESLQAESLGRPRRPLSGYPFSLFDENVNSKIRNILFDRVKPAGTRRTGNRNESDTE